MKQKIDSDKLEIGFYVILPPNNNLSFRQKKFLITSDEQIEQIKKSKVDVYVDLSQSFAEEQVDLISHNDENITPEWEPEKLVSGELKTVMKKGTPEQKSKAVYKQSISLMNNLLEDPSKENIVSTKHEIMNIVEHIIDNDDMTKHLVQITGHDFYTYTHSVNVGILGVLLTKKLFSGDKSHNLKELGAGFFLHDLGKVKVDSSIINKPGKLTDSEMQRMRIHPFQSYKLLQNSGELSQEASIIAMQHHEREDGTGYPRRLKGNEIHDYGRICAIADCFDAITAKRSYKPAMTPFEALQIMKEKLLGHFHKEIFANFVMLFTDDST